MGEVYNAESQCSGPLARWSTHRFADEVRELASLLERFAQSMLATIQRPDSEPRTSPPQSVDDYVSLRDWTRGWRGDLNILIGQVFQRQDQMDRNNIQRLSERRARRLPLPEMEALNQPGVRMPQGPEATTGYPRNPRQEISLRVVVVSS